MKRLTVALVALTICAGCATYRGSKVLSLYSPADLLKQIKKGESTQQDVEDLLGEPLRTEIHDGKLTWYYGCAQDSFVPFPVTVGHAALWVEFEDETVSRVEYRGKITVREKTDSGKETSESPSSD
jgi:outer membrane protein assembly factor BamE (lipoprotein component of BamABCDE complex)